MAPASPTPIARTQRSTRGRVQSQAQVPNPSSAEMAIPSQPSRGNKLGGFQVEQSLHGAKARDGERTEEEEEEDEDEDEDATPKRSTRSRVPRSRHGATSESTPTTARGRVGSLNGSRFGRDEYVGVKRAGSVEGSVSGDSGVGFGGKEVTSASGSKMAFGNGKQPGSQTGSNTAPSSSNSSTIPSKTKPPLNGSKTSKPSTVGTSHKKKVLAASSSTSTGHAHLPASTTGPALPEELQTVKVKPRQKAKPAKYLQKHVSLVPPSGGVRPEQEIRVFGADTATMKKEARGKVGALEAPGPEPEKGAQADQTIRGHLKGEDTEEMDQDDEGRSGSASAPGSLGRAEGRANRAGKGRTELSEDLGRDRDGESRDVFPRLNAEPPAATPRRESNPDSRLHEYPEEPGVAMIDPAILGDIPTMPPAPVIGPEPSTSRMPPGATKLAAEPKKKASKKGAKVQRVAYYQPEPETEDSPTGYDYPASPPPMTDIYPTESTSPFRVIGPAAENQVFSMLGANGKIVNIPPPAHPHLRPGDTITDATTPHIHGCPYCDKVYVGQHARSICRRHQMSKHGIELDVQVKKSRWDNNPNRPATEEEKHQRTLESKRRWAAKDRRRRRCQKLGLPFEDSDKESDEEEDSVRSNSRVPPADTLRHNKKSNSRVVVKRESSYEDSQGSYDPNEDARIDPAAMLPDDGGWESTSHGGYPPRGYYLPDEYAASERGQAQGYERRDSLGRRPSGLANDGYTAAHSAGANGMPISRDRSGSVTSEGSAEPDEEEEPAARGTDSTVNPSYHARSGSWAQQNMAGYGRPAVTQSPYAPNQTSYMQGGSYQPGLSPARTAPSMRSGQVSPPSQYKVPMQGRAILQDGYGSTNQMADFGGPLDGMTASDRYGETTERSRRRDDDDSGAQGQHPAYGMRLAGLPPPSATANGEPIDTGPKTPPLQGSNRGKPSSDLGAAEILLALASPAKQPAEGNGNMREVAKNGGRGAEHARRHRSNSSMSNPASLFPVPEVTPAQPRSIGDRVSAFPAETIVKIEETSPYGQAYDPALVGSTPLPPGAHWRAPPTGTSELEDPFHPPALSHSRYGHSSSASRGSGQTPVTPVELGPPLVINSFRRAPPPAPPAFARGSRMNFEPRLPSDLAIASGFTSPATPLEKTQPPYARPVLAPFEGRFMMTPARNNGMSSDSPIGHPFSSPNGLDLTHQLGLAPTGALPESPTWWANMMGATPDAKLTKRSRLSPDGGDDHDGLAGLVSPTKRARASGMLA